MLVEVEGNEIDDEGKHVQEGIKRRREKRWRKFENEENETLVVSFQSTSESSVSEWDK